MEELYPFHGRLLTQEPAAPSPEPEGSDLVEEYSFNTGNLTSVDGAKFQGWCIENAHYPLSFFGTA